MNPTYFDIPLSLTDADRRTVMAAIQASIPEGAEPGAVIAHPYWDEHTKELRLKGAALQRQAAVAVKAAIKTSK